MSWAAHDLEPYAIQKHAGLKLAFVPLLIGSYSPDMMSKWFVYGIHLGPWDLKASDPAQFHRGWPGVGFTHSLTYGLLIGLLIWKVFGSKLWGVSFMIVMVLIDVLIFRVWARRAFAWRPQVAT